MGALEHFWSGHVRLGKGAGWKGLYRVEGSALMLAGPMSVTSTHSIGILME